MDHYDKREEKVINFLYGDDRETYLKEYEMYKTNDEFFEKLQTVETRYNQLGDKINNDGLPF